jgi:nitroreductase
MSLKEDSNHCSQLTEARVKFAMDNKASNRETTSGDTSSSQSTDTFNIRAKTGDTFYSHQEREHTETLAAETVSESHSKHKFYVDEPVPLDILTKCLSLAQCTPSNNNLQPWRVTVCTGETLIRLKSSLANAFKSHVPLQIPRVPKKYLHLQDKCGQPGCKVTGDPRQARSKEMLENLNNYGAPCLVIASIEKSLSATDIVSVGMYLQTLIILLAEQGLHTIPQASITGYPELIRRELDISDDMTILCGLAIGYPDKARNPNPSRTPRDLWQNNVTFLD